MWAVTTLPDDQLFSFRYEIVGNFYKLLKRSGGEMNSDTFEMHGVPSKLFLHVSQTEVPFDDSEDEDSEEEWDDLDQERKSSSSSSRSPKELEIDGVLVPITSYFNVQLCVENPDAAEEKLKALELCGRLTITQKTVCGKQSKMSGKIFELAPPSAPHRIWSGFVGFDDGEHPSRYTVKDEFRGWSFGTRNPTFEYQPYHYQRKEHRLIYHDFYTVGKVSELTMEVMLGRAGTVTLSSGNMESRPELKSLCFGHFLQKPRFSNFIVKCEGRSFHCHKVILASRWIWFSLSSFLDNFCSFSSNVFEGMFESSMMEEARLGVVEIQDIKEKTMENLLEFIYTKRFPDAASLPELLYAADKYNVTDLVGRVV